MEPSGPKHTVESDNSDLSGTIGAKHTGESGKSDFSRTMWLIFPMFGCHMVLKKSDLSDSPIRFGLMVHEKSDSAHRAQAQPGPLSGPCSQWAML